MKNNTINKKEIEKFSKIAEEWWDPNGKFKPLHMLNPCRLDYIIEMIRTEFACDPAKVKPFSELTILDIGCGPAETVKYFSDVEYIGFDNNPAYIELAKRRFGDQGHFFCGQIDQVALEEFGAFDLVLAVGVLHHLDDSESLSLLKLAYRALKEGGRLITYDGCYVEGQSKIAQFIILSLIHI